MCRDVKEGHAAVSPWRGWIPRPLGKTRANIVIFMTLRGRGGVLPRGKDDDGDGGHGCAVAHRNNHGLRAIGSEPALIWRVRFCARAAGRHRLRFVL